MGTTTTTARTSGGTDAAAVAVGQGTDAAGDRGTQFLQEVSLFDDFVLVLQVRRTSEANGSTCFAEEVVIPEGELVTRHQWLGTGFAAEAFRVIDLIAGSHHEVVLVKALRAFGTFHSK